MSLTAERVLLVGNFFPSGSGAHGVCAELAGELRAAGAQVIETSHRAERWPRVIDMLGTAWRRRHDFDVAHIDVYSGFAFSWAAAVSGALTLAGKPYVLTLHGGSLPEFSERWPVLVRKVFAGAAAVTAPSTYLQTRMAAYRADIRVIPNPIRLEDYTFSVRQPALPN